MKKKLSFQDLINSDQPVLVDFYADWCGPCRAMAPILKDVAKKVREKAKIIKINVDKNPNVSAKYNIRGIPAFILFQNGEIKWQQAGMVSAHHLEQVINNAT